MKHKKSNRIFERRSDLLNSDTCQIVGHETAESKKHIESNLHFIRKTFKSICLLIYQLIHLYILSFAPPFQSVYQPLVIQKFCITEFITVQLITTI